MSYRHISVQPITPALGGEVSSVDLSRDLPDEVFAEIWRAFLDRQVLFFRNQRLTPERQIALSRRFGPLEKVPYIAGLSGHPEVIAVLKEADERAISVFGGDWHSDFSFLERPPLGSILHALEVPSTGGDTLFASQYAAFEALSPKLRSVLEGMEAMHSGHAYGVQRNPTEVLATSRSIRISRDNPEADVERAHPVVRRHPETGRKALFVNPIYTTRFAGMTEEESRPLLETLYRIAVRPEFRCRFRWTPGAVAIWDNRCLLHFAVNDYDGHRRLLHRTTIAGERPLASASLSPAPAERIPAE